MQQQPAHPYGSGYARPMMGGPPQYGMPGQWVNGPLKPQPAPPVRYIHPAQYMHRPVQYGSQPQWQAAPQHSSATQQPAPIQHLPLPTVRPTLFNQVQPQPSVPTYRQDPDPTCPRYYAQGPNAVQAAFSAAGLSQTGVSNTELARSLQDYVTTMPREQRQRLQKKPEGNKVEKTRSTAKHQGVEVTVFTTPARRIKQEQCESVKRKGQNRKVYFEDMLEKVVKVKQEPM